MDNTIDTQIVSAKQRIIFMEAIRDTTPDERLRQAWDGPIQQLRLALAHFELALQLEQSATVPAEYASLARVARVGASG